MPTSTTGVTIRVISNRIPSLPDEVRKLVAAEVERGIYAVEAGAKQKAPVKTGTLRRSIHSVFERGGLRGICGPSVLYGIFVEFGTRHMAARPYMRPAAEAALPKLVDALKRALGGLK